MATEIVENDIASKFGNSPQKTGEPLDHAKLYSGKALEFDGIGDYLDTGVDLESWLEQDDKTMSVWVRNDGNTAEARVFNVGYSGSGSTGSTGFALGFDAGTDNKPFYFLRNESAGALKVEFGEVQPVGTWHYYVIVQDTSENEAYIYQNGVLMTTVSSVGVISQSTDLTAKIGKFWTLSELNYFKGALSNFQLWNKAWSTSDVQYAYTNPERLITDNASVTSGITTSDLELWYPMNDTGVRSPQTVVFDAAGTNNTTKNHATTTFLGDELNTNANATSPTNEANATTGWSSVNINVIQSQSSVYSVGSYALELNENAGPTNGARAYMDLEASPFSLVDGRTYTLSVLARHVGSGGQWTINAGSSTSNTSGGVIATITNSTTSFTEYTSTWVHDGDHRYINIQENSSDNDGGLYIDKLSIKEVGIASGWTDADQQQTIPQTALMDGSVKAFFHRTEQRHVSYVGSIGSGSATYSVSMWIYKNDSSGAQYLFDARTSGGTGYATFNFSATAITVASGNVYVNGVDTSSITVDKWQHVVVTGITLNPSSQFMIGGASTGAYNFGGLMDEIALFTGTLTEPEIISLYNSGLPLNATKHSQASNLVGYWRNNDLHTDGKWKDYSGNGRHATIYSDGSADSDDYEYVFFQEGITADKDSQGFPNTIQHPSNGALHLNGSTMAGSYEADYVDLGYNIDIDGDFTVEMWRKMTNVFSSNADGYILGADNVDFVVIPFLISSGKLHQVYIRTNSGDTNTITLDSSTDGVDLRPSIYEWFHIAFLRESGTYKVYINGVDLNTGDRETGNSANNFTFKEIAMMVGTGNQGQGFVDELKIYDKALTVPEAKKNYKHGKAKHKNS